METTVQRSDLEPPETAEPLEPLEPAAPLEPTDRSTVRRGRKRAVSDRQVLHEILAAGRVCHLGVVLGDGEQAHPLVVPTAYGVDLDGPDPGGTLYLHGSVASGSIQAAPEQDVCVTVTHLDGLVFARSGFHHSMNYRSAVVIGRPRPVQGEEKVRALDAVVDQVAAGRSAELRPMTRKELAATAVVALPLAEASVKVRAGGPVDDAADVADGGWAGHLPLTTRPLPPVPSADCAEAEQLPASVRRLLDDPDDPESPQSPESPGAPDGSPGAAPTRLTP